MKSFNTAFTDINDLENQLDSHTITDSSQLLIQCYITSLDTEFIYELQDFVTRHFPQAILIGSTSDGVINQNSVYIEHKHVIIFSSFEKTAIRSTLLEYDQTYQDSFQSGVHIAQELLTDRSKVLISFADGIHTNGEEYIRGINSINSRLIIAGGLAGDNGRVEKTYIFSKNKITSNGAVAVVLDSEDLHVSTDYSFDWIPIGKRMKVTRAIKNRVYEIEGLSAVDIYAKYLGKELAHQLPRTGIEFPLILTNNNELLGRAVLFKHDDNSLTFAGNIQEGERVQFGVGNVEMILRGSDYHLRHLIQESSYEIETVFIYSCMARRRFLGPYIEKEIDAFSHIAPAAGFFTYGEFFHHNDEAQLLNETMTVLALSESTQPAQKKVDNELTMQNHFAVNALHALAHLSNRVSHELEELNSNLEDRIKTSTDIIYKQAYFDKLTQLPNRLKLISDLPSYIGYTFILINIDDFTLINDFYGHSAGDHVLKELSILIRNKAASFNGHLYKLPSDEFAIIVPSFENKDKLENNIQQCIADVEKNQFLYENNPIRITVTVAVSKVNTQGSGYINADMTLKQAKKSNHSYMIFEEGMMLNKQYKENLYIANAIRRAIKTDNIFPFYQPIVDLKTSKIAKYECLVRLREKNNNIMSPFSFLSVSQKLKLYPKITQIMIEKTFKKFQNTGLNFTINLAFDDIFNRETHNFIFEKIEHYQIAKQLTFEILETQELENKPQIRAFIRKLKALGVKVAIDDFGSGFANFKHMTTIDADFIKIDGSLIKNINIDDNAKLVVETIVIFAKKLGVKTIAEFVHSQEVLDVVASLNIDYVQGYHLGEPKQELVDE